MTASNRSAKAARPPVPPAGPGAALRSGHAGSKVQPWHLDRLAVVYVRQSTAQQVSENRESADRQYALARRAADLGWPADRVIVIDEDQGRSGATAEGRLGFQRLLAEVGLDHVGVVFGLEMSRLARSCKDWHQLLELCGLFRTLLADADGVYDPTDHSDRLLLGLTGIMSEAELHVLRGRMRQGMLNKARRGDVFLTAPIGYIKSSSGGLELDPDEQARGVVRLIFDQFDRLGTIRKVLRYLLHHGVRIGVRPHAGPNRGRLEWRPPTRDTVGGILRHPIYAGFYCYGRRQVDARRKTPGRPSSGRVAVPADAYHALIPDHCPGYIDRARYDAIRRRLASNRARAESKGAPRNGESLLAGLVACERCGRRMAVHYSGRGRHLRYVCRSGAGCRRSIAGRVLDELVARQVLEAVRPGALELSLAAADDVLRERAALDGNWGQRLERAKTEARRVERQYAAVEPENRLVARTLERQWEDALRDVRELEEAYARFTRTQPMALTRREVDQIRAMAGDLPDLWAAPTTTPADRQQIIGFLVDRVTVSVAETGNRAGVAVTWVGGHVSRHEVVRPVSGYDQVADFEQLLARVQVLRDSGLSYSRIAELLNEEGRHRPPKCAEGFHGDMVGRILRRRTPAVSGRRERARSVLGEGEWLTADLAARLGVGKSTLHAWLRRGWIGYRRLPGYRGRCICWADRSELTRLARLARTPNGWWDPPLPAGLTTPKLPPKRQV